MIQLKGYNTLAQYFYINLYDEMIQNGSETSMKPLVSLTSQLTGKTKNFLPFTADYTDKDRCVKMGVNLVSAEVNPLLPVSGYIKLGDSDFPYGFYDVKIYQNDPAYPSNLDPSTNTIKLLYTGS